MSVLRKRILAISSELPWPLDTGGHLRTFHLLRALAGRYDVTLVTTVHSHRLSDVDTVRSSGIHVRAAPVGRRSAAGEMRRLLTASLKREPYVLFHRHNRPEVRRMVRRAVLDDAPDAVYFDHLDALVYRDELRGRPWILDLHNVYSTLAHREATERRSSAVSALLRREAALLDRAERRALSEVGLTLAVSEEDASVFRRRGGRSVTVVPNGVDVAAYAALPIGRPAEHPPTLLYVGALSWPPNVAAASYLARELLPRVRARWPSARVSLVGRDPSPEALALAAQPGVDVYGNVPDVRPYLESASVLAVPLEAGGGTRLKILEAFAGGLPVVSTAVGCEGIDAFDGVHLLVAERAAMADRIGDLLAQPELARSLAGRARALAERVYDWRAIGRTAMEAIERVAV